MPLTIGFTSRSTALKGNPNRDPATGRYSEGSGMRHGGTEGAPITDAFGNPLKGGGRSKGELERERQRHAAEDVRARMARQRATLGVTPGPSAGVTKGEGHIHTDKWHRCVEHVKAQGGDVDPHAVCTSSLGYEGSVNPEHQRRSQKQSFSEVLKWNKAQHPRGKGGLFEKISGVIDTVVGAADRAISEGVDFNIPILDTVVGVADRVISGSPLDWDMPLALRQAPGLKGKIARTKYRVGSPEYRTEIQRQALSKKWDESKHPRNPEGSEGGGKFTSKPNPVTATSDEKDTKESKPTEEKPKEKATGTFVKDKSTGSDEEKQKARELAMDAARKKRQGKHTPLSTSLTPSQKAMQIALARQSKKPVHKVKNAEEAVALVLKGENVEITDTKDVHTVLKKLGELALEAQDKKEKAPNWDPCTITVKGVSLFCSEKLKTKEFPHGIPRIEMPQFKSKTPTPGSEADKLPRDKNGEVDGSEAFIQHLQESGVKVEADAKMLARKLKASQAEMEGVKVAGMMLAAENNPKTIKDGTTGKEIPNPKYRDPKKARIWVSRDGYVIDGHHTWAASVGLDAKDGNLDNDKEMDVQIVDLTMSEIYHLSVPWTRKFGLPAAGVKKIDVLRFVPCLNC